MSVSTLISGRRPVTEALRRGGVHRVYLARGVSDRGVAEILKLAADAQVPSEWVPRLTIDRMLGTTSHQGVVAETEAIEYAPEDAPQALAKSRGQRLCMVALDGITDPHNYGAIIRSAEVLGAHGVATEARRSAPLNTATLKVAAGAAGHLPLVQVVNLPRFLASLKARNVWIYGADERGEDLAEALDPLRDLCLVIGSEGSGLRRLVKETCDHLVRIPVQGRIASLNASVAAAILIYEVFRARRRAELEA